MMATNTTNVSSAPTTNVSSALNTNGFNAPFTTELLKPQTPVPQVQQTPAPPLPIIDNFPATFRDANGRVEIPIDEPVGFLSADLSLKKLEVLEKYLRAIGSKRPAKPINYHILLGREIILSERMDLHLVWANDGRIFIKPLSRYLLDPNVWGQQLRCKPNCQCQQYSANVVPGAAGNGGALNNGSANANQPRGNVQASMSIPESCEEKKLRDRASGFLYSYVCLITHESEFMFAKEHHLLPRRDDGSEIQWDGWKKFSKEIITQHTETHVHPRFHRGELRLSRLNFFSRFTQWPPFTSYLRDWRNYSTLVRDNMTSLATVTVFIALVLTAFQVGHATDQLKENATFMGASYGFTIFAILAPLFVLFLVILEVIYNLVKDNLLSKKGSTERPISARAHQGSGPANIV